MNKYPKIKHLLVLVFLSSQYILTYAQTPNWYAPDLRGKYCEARTHKCCVGRQDECSAPILGTLCYCDDFCNRTRNEDCCPDFWTFCKGFSAPEEIFQRMCIHNGIPQKDGEITRSNCNECKCQEINGQMEVLCENHKCLTDEELLERVNRNSRSYGWRASNYSIFWGRKYEDGLLLRLGTLHSRKKVLQMAPIKQVIDVGAIPRTFDARTVWPGRISLPKDQGWCGASWIFSTVSVASDRFAIMTHGNDQEFLSPQQLLDCSRNQRGCNGGHLTRAWTYIRKYGLVPDNCYAWEARPLSACKVPRHKKAISAHCPTSSPYIKISKGELHRVGPVYRIASESGIMHEIMHSGPVQATMKVSRDFFSYNTGVYRCSNITASDRSTYHSVRIIGWGEEYQNGQLVKYWIVANSWGLWWGENGFFRIQKGNNECLIEDFIIASWAKVENINAIIDTARFARANYLNPRTRN